MFSFKITSKFFAALCCILTVLAGALIQSAAPVSVAQGTNGQRKYEIEPCKGARCATRRPIEVAAVRNLNSAYWLRDIEIDIKNISDKPIYYVRFGVKMPGVNIEGGKTYGFMLRFGNHDLVRVGNLAQPDDEFIKPGATYTFKVPGEKWRGFEKFSAETKLPEAATQKINFRIDTVSFGDGSGHIMGGVPFKSGKPIARVSPRNISADFVKANFSTPGAAPEPQSCFPSGCARRELRQVWCRYQEGGYTGSSYLCEQERALNSSDPETPCSKLGESMYWYCEDTWWSCHDETLEDC